MKVLIVGRSGTGKDTLANILTEQYGLQQVISYTTRPKRFPEENTHRFVTEEEARTIQDRIAETAISGYEYFATTKQVEEADVYIVDPEGFYQVVKKMPDTHFMLVYMRANEDLARTHAITRAENMAREIIVYNDRTAAEDEQFTLFEDALADHENFRCIKNCSVIVDHTNDYTEESMQSLARTIAAHVHLWENLLKVVHVAASHNILEEKNGRIRAIMLDWTVKWLSPDNFVASIVNDNEGLGMLVRQCLFLPEVKI